MRCLISVVVGDDVQAASRLHPHLDLRFILLDGSLVEIAVHHATRLLELPAGTAVTLLSDTLPG